MTFHVLKENNNNYGTGLVETADYEEGSGRSRVWGGEGGRRRGEELGGVWIPPKFKYPSELSTQYLAAVNCHEIDTR